MLSSDTHPNPQLDLLIPTIRPKTVHIQPLERVLEKLYEHLTGMPSVSPVHPLETGPALSSFKSKSKKARGKEKEKADEVGIAVSYPDPPPAQSTAWKVSFESPEPKGINVVGSWQDGMAVRKPDGAPFAVDVLVEMPAVSIPYQLYVVTYFLWQILFQEKDYRNLRVFHKRAFYLACIASSLQHTPAFSTTLDIKYESPEGDTRKTVLILTPKAGKEKGKHPLHR